MEETWVSPAAGLSAAAAGWFVAAGFAGLLGLGGHHMSTGMHDGAGLAAGGERALVQVPQFRKRLVAAAEVFAVQWMCVTSCSGVLDRLLMLLRVAVKFGRVNLGLPQPQPLPLLVPCQRSLAWWIRSVLLCS